MWEYEIITLIETDLSSVTDYDAYTANYIISNKLVNLITLREDNYKLLIIDMFWDFRTIYYRECDDC